MTILFYIQPRTILRVKKGDTNYDTGTAGINQTLLGKLEYIIILNINQELGR